MIWSIFWPWWFFSRFLRLAATSFSVKSMEPPNLQPPVVRLRTAPSAYCLLLFESLSLWWWWRSRNFELWARMKRLFLSNDEHFAIGLFYRPSHDKIVASLLRAKHLPCFWIQAINICDNRELSPSPFDLISTLTTPVPIYFVDRYMFEPVLYCRHKGLMFEIWSGRQGLCGDGGQICCRGRRLLNEWVRNPSNGRPQYLSQK